MTERTKLVYNSEFETVGVLYCSGFNYFHLWTVYSPWAIRLTRRLILLLRLQFIPKTIFRWSEEVIITFILSQKAEIPTVITPELRHYCGAFCCAGRPEEGARVGSDVITLLPNLNCCSGLPPTRDIPPPGGQATHPCVYFVRMYIAASLNQYDIPVQEDKYICHCYAQKCVFFLLWMNWRNCEW